MATSDGTAIDDGQGKGGRAREDERWRELPDGYALLSMVEVRGVYALLASKGVAETCKRLKTSADGIEACCFGGALISVVDDVRSRLAAAATWIA